MMHSTFGPVLALNLGNLVNFGKSLSLFSRKICFIKSNAGWHSGAVASAVASQH